MAAINFSAQIFIWRIVSATRAKRSDVTKPMALQHDITPCNVWKPDAEILRLIRMWNPQNLLQDA
jgi:hypothetical protein